jgi:hypothetical protein
MYSVQSLVDLTYKGEGDENSDELGTEEYGDGLLIS